MGDSGSLTIGIDIGTTSVKGVLAAPDGTVLDRVRLPHELRAPSADIFEHDPAAAWAGGARRAWERLSDGRDVAGVAVAAMVPSLCAVDGAGRPLTAGLLYGDARGRRHAAGEAVGFAAALAEAAPGAAGYWPAQAVANHALCGVGAVDTTTAMATHPLFEGRGWDEALCAEAGVDPARLPATSPGARSIGRIGATVVGGGTVDVFAEQLVADARAPGDVLVICGTTLIPWVLTEDWREVEGLWAVPYTEPGVLACGGASNAGGLFVDWVRRLVGEPGDAAVAEVAPARVPVWLPYVRGERTPLHDPDRRAELLDADIGHGPAAVLRAAYEASGFVVRHHVDLAAAGAPPGAVPARRIVAVGGGARSAEWMQALADATGLPVDVTAVPEGAALGAAWLARMSAGLEDGTAGARAWARVSHRVEPRDAWADACAARYARFRARTGVQEPDRTVG